MRDVYILEDDVNICELVDCALSSSDIRLTCFHTVGAFYKGLEKRRPDLCLVDVMLPDGSGLDVLARIGGVLPCIVLSALGRETDKVKGLNLGAEDYVTKPFGVMELAARVNAALRRHASKETGTLVLGDLTVDRDAARVTLSGKPLALNPKEFKLLLYLIDNRGRLLTRDAILTAVWGYDAGETRTVDNHVARLRRAGVEGIVTVHGLGYKFEAT